MSQAPTLTGLGGKVALITGAGRMRSIGRSIALGLARAGCDIALVGTGRDPSQFPDDEKEVDWGDIDSVADEIRGLGQRALAIVADISDEDDVKRIFTQAQEELGTVSFLVNNAAATRGSDRKPVIDLDVDAWDLVQRVNVRGTFLMSKYFAQHLVDAGAPGGIINISSIGGKIAGANMAAYSSSKAAVQALTSSMSKELGRHGIRVNAICPGVIDTNRITDRTPEQWQEYVDSTIPMGRMGTGDDVTNTALFLLSDEAGWITGQSWNVDGGHLTVR